MPEIDPASVIATDYYGPDTASPNTGVPQQESSRAPALGVQPNAEEQTRPSNPGIPKPGAEETRQAYLETFNKIRGRRKPSAEILQEKIRGSWLNPDEKDTEFSDVAGLDDNEPDWYRPGNNSTDVANYGETRYTADRKERRLSDPAGMALYTSSAANPVLYSNRDINPGYYDEASSDPKDFPGYTYRDSTFELSNMGYELLMKMEGFRSDIYDAGDGRKTIGYGHVCSPNEAEKYKKGISKEEAYQLLVNDVDNRFIASSLAPFIKENNIKLTQNQLDALVMFTYNVGENRWDDKPSDLTIKRLLLSGNYTPDQIKQAFGLWVNTKDGKGVTHKSSGLWSRRMDEADLFNNGNYDYDDNGTPPEGYEDNW